MIATTGTLPLEPRPPLHPMPTLSLANLMTIDAEPLEQIEAAAAAGFGAVGLAINPPDRLGRPGR